MRTALVLLCIGCCLTVSQADDVRYPRVYGFTGRPYGPTQAHYQYQRQYGRPWHGYGGISVSSGVQSGLVTGGFSGSYSSVVGGYGYLNHGYSLSPYSWPVTGYGYPSVFAPQFYGYYSVGPTFQYSTWPSVVYPGTLPAWDPPLLPNPAMERFQLEEIERWHLPVDIGLDERLKPNIPVSSAAARLKSVEAQTDGDAAFRRQDFHHAYDRYKHAWAVANDLGTPHFRMAFTLIALKQYARAVEYLKLGLRRDPSWPVSGETIRTLYGPDNDLLREVHLQGVLNWVREDIRDPDRLFVLGIMLHFDERADDAALCFEAALRLAGGGDHLKLFLQSQRPLAAIGQDATLQPAVEQPDLGVELPGVPPPPAPAAPAGNDPPNDPVGREPLGFRVPAPEAP